MSLFTIKIKEYYQSDLECSVIVHLIEQAANHSLHKEHPWGECDVIAGEELHRVQWSYCGLDEDGEFEDGIIDVQIDCSWRVE